MQFRGTKGSRNRRSILSRTSQIERLEDRRLLSSIVWSNRGVTSGAHSDRFNDVFGANANLARSVADAAITSWSQIINSFNYAGGGNTFTIEIQMDATGVGFGAQCGANSFSSDGKPLGAYMHVARGDDLDNDSNGDGGRYFLDPTPFDQSEFTTIRNAFFADATATSPALGKADLYMLLLHELGHGVGLYPSNQIQSLSTKTTTADTIDYPLLNGSPGTVGYYWRFDGPSVQTLETSFDSGGTGGTPYDANGSQHHAPQGASVTVGSTTYYGGDDLMNPVYFLGQRKIVSQVDALMLKDAYGYTVTEPATLPTMYNTLDSDGTLRVNTSRSSADQINLSVFGASVLSSISLGSPVLGIDPSGFTTATFTQSSIQRIKITGSSGADTITIGQFGNTPVTITGSAGVDILNVSGAFGTTTIDGTSVVGSGQNITSIEGIQNINVLGTSSPDTFVVTGCAADTLTIDGASGNDTFNLGQSQDWASSTINVPVTIIGSGGDDTLNVGNGAVDTIANTITFDGGTQSTGIGDRVIYNDTVVVFGAIYDLNPAYVSRQGFRTESVNFSSTEGVTINCAKGQDLVTIRNGIAWNLQVNGNDGDDVFTKGDGILSGANPSNTLAGGNGNDQLIFDDSLDSVFRDWNIGANVLSQGATNYSTAGFESVGLLAGTANDTITLSGTIQQYVSVNAGGGNDLIGWNAVKNQAIVGGSNAYAYTASLDGGGGTNTIQVEHDTSAATTFTISASTVTTKIQTAGVGNYSIGQLSYASFSTFYSFGSGNADTFNLMGTAFLTSYTLEALGGDDVFNLSTDPLTHSIFNVLLTGDSGNDSLNIDDSAYSNGAAYMVNGTATAAAFGQISARYYNYDSTIENYSLIAAQDDNYIDVQSAPGSVNVVPTINGGGGNDAIRLGDLANFRDVEAIGPRSAFVDGGAGSNSIIFDNSTDTRAGADGISYYYVSGNELSQYRLVPSFFNNYASVIYSNFGSLTLDTGTSIPSSIREDIGNGGTPVDVKAMGGSMQDTLNADNTPSGHPMIILPSAGDDLVDINTDGGDVGAVAFNSTQHLGSLHVRSGGSASVLSNGGRVLVTKSLIIDGGGYLDLNDNEMVVKYSGSTVLPTIQSLVNLARNSGWHGVGVTSTSAFASTKGNVTLGAMEATSYKSIYGPAAVFAGEAIDNASVLVKYTYYGDANFNGRVDGGDYARIDLGFGQHASGWNNGDFNGDGKVDGSDYGLIDFAFGTQGGAINPPGVAPKLGGGRVGGSGAK